MKRERWWPCVSLSHVCPLHVRTRERAGRGGMSSFLAFSLMEHRLYREDNLVAACAASD